MSAKKKSTKKSQKSDEVTEVIESGEEVKSSSQQHDAREEDSEGSNEECHTSTTTPQMHNSPTAATMATSSSIASSSPSQSVANAAAIENDARNDDQNHDVVSHESQSIADEAAKASWESGILDLSSSSFITVKFLVSNNMAGSIIGRAGETISELQEQSSSRIKLGQSGDCYPGTSERACLVHGSLENVKKAATLLLQKLYDLQLQQVEAQLGRHASQRGSKGTLKEDVARKATSMLCLYTIQINKRRQNVLVFIL